MKIVISTAVYYPMTNGVAVFAHNLAVGMAERGHEVMVLCPSLTGKNHISRQGKVKVAYLKSIKVPVYPDQIAPIPPKKKLFGKEMPHVFYKNGFHVSVFPMREVKRVLGKFKPDVVHCQISDPIGVTVVNYAEKHHIPLVTTEHNYPDVITDQFKLPKALKKPINSILASYFVNRQKHSDYVTMPTQMAIEDLILSRDKDFNVPIEALSNGVDLSAFKPGDAPAEIYKKYQLPTDRPIALYVGRVDPEKQIGIVLRAFEKVLKKVPEALLVIVGEGVDRLRLEQIAVELDIMNSVKFLGRVLPPELYDLYRVGDFFVTASEIETQGIVLIEAAASGLPLIAVNKGAVGEICHNGENGFLCAPKDVEAIANGIERLFIDEDLRKKYAARSVELSKQHDINHTLSRFEEIYQTVIENKS